MSIYIACSLFATMILVYWVIAELFTMLFRFTGLPDERARFQVVSLLTGCGFTTRESEMILSSRSRRRLARITMLFGYVFNITIVSAFVNVFLSLKLVQAEHTFAAVLIPLAAALVVLALGRIRPVRARIDGLIGKLVGKLLRRGAENTVLLIDYIGADSIAVVTLKHVPDHLAGIPLRDSGLRNQENILVMLMERGGQKASAVSADTVFLPGDKLTVFGSFTAVCRAFEAEERFEG
jgi:hypothetical protein